VTPDPRKRSGESDFESDRQSVGEMTNDLSAIDADASYLINPGVNTPWAAQPRNLMCRTWIAR
jgi:hypothetical protein